MNNMDDDKLKSLFAGFDPELSSDSLFLSRLECNLDSVEDIKRQTAGFRARTRRAVALAALAGFVVGVLFSLALPYLGRALAEWRLSWPDDFFLNTFADNYMVVAWLAVAATSVFAALSTYEISLSFSKPLSR